MSALSTVGEIKRKGGVTVVRLQGGTDSKVTTLPGVTCENPDAPLSQRVYRKEFSRKPIYLSDEIDEARANHLRGNGTMVLGMSGYSSVSSEQCHEWGIKPESYECACMEVLATA